MQAAICTSSSNSMRATGMPVCMMAMTVSTASASVGNWQVADDIASGMPCSRKLDFGDDAERALGADEQARQVVAGGGFAHPPAGADHPPVGQSDRQAQHVLAHRAVAHRVGARRAGRAHAADGAGRGAGIDREEQPGVAQMGVELRRASRRPRRGSPCRPG